MPPRVKITPPGMIAGACIVLALAVAQVNFAAEKPAAEHAASPAKSAEKEGASAIAKQPQSHGEDKKEVGTEGKAQLLQDLDRQVELRRSEVAREEERLNATKAALEAVKGELRKEYEKLEALKRDVEEQIARRDKVVNERLDTIAKVYQSMKPKEAATALEGMENGMAVAILERLPGKTVAKFFDAMPKERVRELTRLMEEGHKK